MRKCTECHKEKVREEFYKRANGQYYTKCRNCMKSKAETSRRLRAEALVARKEGLPHAHLLSKSWREMAEEFPTP